ncbi:MAG: hypothetical protein AB7R89_07410 [Dehalococcoidia bacterium]
MTSATVSVDDLLAWIHQAGYWRVVIHPATFEDDRIQTLGDCWRLVEESRVGQRGWDYPYVDREDRVIGDGWVQCGTALGNLIEVWRFYQSGQFVHHFAVSEDREDSWERTRTPSAPVDAPRTLSIFNVIYTMAEILEFTRRLAHRDVFGSAVSIRIELHGMLGRKLTAPPERWLRQEYISSTETICWERTMPSAVLIADAPNVAIDATAHVFERFQWIEPSLQMLKDEQRRFYEKRWR